jgi:hypothetical protein
VTVIGTGWREHGTRGTDVPIWIGFANVVARGHPDANGRFSVSFTILPSTPQGDLIISAIIGNGGSADTIYTVSDTQPMGCVDAYFIGVHGTLEDAQSPEIEKTWQAFDAKPQRTKLLFSPASHIMLQTSKVGNPANFFVPAEQEGLNKLDALIRKNILKQLSNAEYCSCGLFTWGVGH